MRGRRRVRSVCPLPDGARGGRRGGNDADSSAGVLPPLRIWWAAGPLSWRRGSGPTTNMALCLAEADRMPGFDPVDQLRRYWRWYKENHSPKGYCFDIGNTTRCALENSGTREPWCGPTSPGRQGMVRCAAGAGSDGVCGAAERCCNTRGTARGRRMGRWRRWTRAAISPGCCWGLRGETKTLLAPLYCPVEGAGTRRRSRRDPRVASGSFEQSRRDSGRRLRVLALEAALWALYKTDNFRTSASWRRTSRTTRTRRRRSTGDRREYYGAGDRRWPGRCRELIASLRGGCGG